MKKELFRKELSNLNPYVPGKPIEETQKEYGLKEIIKLASNENQLGASPKAIEAVKNELGNLNLYPDAGAMEVREALAKKYNLDYDNIVMGNGGEQILEIIAQAMVNPGDEAIMADITFALYKTSVTHMGGIAVEVPLKDYKHDFDGFISKINTKTKLIYVCNPNNPIPNIMTQNELDYLVERIPEDIVLVIDEAYYEYAIKNPDYPHSLEILKKRPNTIILRTFSKVGGIAGLRIGYGLTSKEISKEMNKIKGVFNVNRLAQAAALGILDDQDHIDKTVELNYRSLELMEKAFKDLDFDYIESNTNFIMVNVGRHSKEVFEELIRRGIIIRPGYLWGMDKWLRISTGTVEQTERLIGALREIFAK